MEKINFISWSEFSSIYKTKSGWTVECMNGEKWHSDHLQSMDTGGLGADFYRPALISKTKEEKQRGIELLENYIEAAIALHNFQYPDVKLDIEKVLSGLKKKC